MKIRTLCKYLILIAICLGLTTHAYAASDKITCSDISSVDFKNLSFNVKDVPFEFHSGKAINYNSPDKVSDHPPEEPPDWEAEIESDNLVNVSAKNIPVRFLLIHNSHLYGSGWNYYEVGFKCSKGILKPVFALNGHLSLRIEDFNTNGIVISTIPRGKTARKYSTYVWSDKAKKYIRSSDSVKN